MDLAGGRRAARAATCLFPEPPSPGQRRLRGYRRTSCASRPPPTRPKDRRAIARTPGVRFLVPCRVVTILRIVVVLSQFANSQRAPWRFCGKRRRVRAPCHFAPSSCHSTVPNARLMHCRRRTRSRRASVPNCTLSARQQMTRTPSTCDCRRRGHSATLRDDRVHVVVSEDPVGVIDRQRDELGSAVVCLATRGRGRVAGTFIGSVAREVVRLSRDPIVAVGPLAERPPRFVSRKSPAPLREPLSLPRLVACVDGSPASENGPPYRGGVGDSTDDVARNTDGGRSVASPASTGR